ncbi:hypothetical protein CON64_14135 [Bacillus pseudomycoides]|nr:hypothetical protein CON64_14135 [Bacillus pseudomycoides]
MRFILVLVFSFILTGCANPSNSNLTNVDKKIVVEPQESNKQIGILTDSEINWEVSPTFKVKEKTLKGTKKEMGVIDKPFIAGKVNQYTWYFWKDNLPEGTFKVIAIQKDTNKQISALVEERKEKFVRVWEIEGLKRSEKDANAQVTAFMSLPSNGLWCLYAIVGDEVIGQVTIDVQKN